MKTYKKFLNEEKYMRTKYDLLKYVQSNKVTAVEVFENSEVTKYTSSVLDSVKKKVASTRKPITIVIIEH